MHAYKLCIAKTYAPRQGSFGRGSRQTCRMTDAPGCGVAARVLSHATPSPASQSSCGLITCVWRMLNSGCCPCMRCGTEQVSKPPCCTSACVGDLLLKLVLINILLLQQTSVMCFCTRSRSSFNTEYTCNETQWLRSSDGNIFSPKYSQIVSKMGEI